MATRYIVDKAPVSSSEEGRVRVELTIWDTESERGGQQEHDRAQGLRSRFGLRPRSRQAPGLGERISIFFHYTTMST